MDGSWSNIFFVAYPKSSFSVANVGAARMIPSSPNTCPPISAEIMIAAGCTSSVSPISFGVTTWSSTMSITIAIAITKITYISFVRPNGVGSCMMAPMMKPIQPIQAPR